MSIIDDVMKLSNVSISTKTQARITANNMVVTNYEASTLLAEVVWMAATNFPMWQFRVIDGSVRTRDTLKVEHFAVYEDGENIGTIASAYYRRKWNVAISCRRARALLDRGDTLHTTDTSKAMSHIKKLFAKRTPAETIADAASAADRALSQAGWTNGNQIKAEYDKFSTLMLEYTIEDAAAAFKDYLEKRGVKPTVAEAVNAYLGLRKDGEVIKSINTYYRTGKTCLTVLDGGKYVVKKATEPAVMYADDTLPEALRGKLGLLKLVTNGQMVEDVGCRVSETVFVLVVE